MTDLRKDRTRVAPTTAATVLLSAGGVVVGAVLGALLDPVAGWVSRQGWLPFQALLDQVDRFAGWSPVWAQLLVGAAVGLAVGMFLVSQATVVEVDGREIVVVQGSTRRRFARSQVGAAVLEGRHLSLRDHADVDLVREGVDGDVATLQDALREHGWPVRG